MQTIGFGTLLSRYFFFSWLYRDVNRGTRFERAAAWRYNREHADWLVTYMRRWLWSGALLCCAGAFVELVLGAPVASACFYVPAACSVSVDAVIATTWVGLKTLPEPL